MGMVDDGEFTLVNILTLMNVDTGEPHNAAHKQTQQEELEQLLTNLRDQDDQDDCPHGIINAIQAMSMRDIKFSEDEELIQDKWSDANASSNDSSSSYRVSEVMCTRPGTPDNLSTHGNCVFGNSTQWLIHFR